jgi:hypothetical protein
MRKSHKHHGSIPGRIGCRSAPHEQIMCAIARARFLARAGVGFGKVFLDAEVQMVRVAHSSPGSMRIEGTVYMSKLHNLGWVMARCFICCTAAILMIGLAALENRVAGGFPHVTRASNDFHKQLLLQANAAPAFRISASKSQSVTERYEQFPLSFEPNREQTNAEVKFLARGEGYILFLTDKDAVLRLGKGPRNSSVLRMSLLGANAKPNFTGMDELPGKSNYLIGNQPDHWHTNIPNYGKVAEHNIYQGVDLVYYGTQRQLEYDFVIAPGASPSKIQIAFEGAKNLHTEANGDLVLSVAGDNDVRLHKPIAYQQTGAEKQLVAANYVLKERY